MVSLLLFKVLKRLTLDLEMGSAFSWLGSGPNSAGNQL